MRNAPGTPGPGRRRALRAALLLVGHGSRVAPANALLRGVARRLRALFPDRIVLACFLEAARPDVETALLTCAGRGADRVVLVPYFLYLGGHVGRDLPRIAKRARRLRPGLRIRIAPHLGSDARLVALAADRARRGLRTAGWK